MRRLARRRVERVEPVIGADPGGLDRVARGVERLAEQPRVEVGCLHVEPEQRLHQPPIAGGDEPAARDPAGREDDRVRVDPVDARGRLKLDGDDPPAHDLDTVDVLADLDPAAGRADQRSQRPPQADARDAGRHEGDLERVEG